MAQLVTQLHLLKWQIKPRRGIHHILVLFAMLNSSLQHSYTVTNVKNEKLFLSHRIYNQ